MGQVLPGLGAAAGLFAGGPCTLTGSLSASGATATVTGTLRNVDVPASNSGRLQVRNLVIPSTGVPQISDNGALFGAIAENDILTFTSVETIQARALTLTSPETVTFNLYDVDTNTLVQSVSIART